MKESKEKGAMKEKAIIGIVATAVIIVAMFATLPTRAAFVGQIKIGIIGPYGLDHWSPAGMKDAAEMAAEEINAAGGVPLADGDYEIVLAFGNDHTLPPPGGDPDAAALEMERLIVDEGCEFIIGGFRTETTAAMLEVAAAYGVPFFINGASTTELIATTVPVDYGKYKYLFRVNPINSSALVKELAGFLQYTIPTKLLSLYGHNLWEGAPNPQVRVAVLTEDLEWTLLIHALLTNPAAYGLGPYGLLGQYANVTYAGRIPDGTTDCTPWLSDVIASEARVMIHIFSGIAGVPLIAQWNAMNVSALPVGINVLAQTQGHWANTGGGCEYESILNFVGYRTPIIPGVTEVFWDNFVARTGVWPIYTAFGGYDGVHGLAEALGAIGTKDKDALVAYYEDPAYERHQLNGIFKFDSFHDVYSSEVGPTWTEGYVRGLVCQWQAGQMEVVCPVDQPYTKRWAIPPWMYELTTDLDFDGKVGIKDLFTVASAFGSSSGDPRWEMEADLDGDGYVGIKDIFRVAQDFGKEISLPLP